MKELYVPLAFDENLKLVGPNEAEKGKLYNCPSCMDTLILRQGDIRIHHFAHRTTNVCTQETIIHKTAKRLICKVVDDWKKGRGQAPKVLRKCPKCFRLIEQALPDKVQTTKEEYVIGEYRADVVLLVENTPAAAVEICVTHAVDEDKGVNLPIPFIELDGEAVLQNSLLWKPIVDKFKPFICTDCVKEEKLKQIKLVKASKATGIPIPTTYYITGVTECWKCHKDILVFTWPEHEDFPEVAPKIKPIPKTVQYRYSNTTRSSYWANTCPYCQILQGDFFLFCEPDGPFFGMEFDNDTP